MFQDMRSSSKHTLTAQPVGRDDPAGFKQSPRGPALTHCICQTQISATTSPTGGLLPLPCFLSCVGFVSAYRGPHLCSLSVFSLFFCLVSFLPPVCSFISSFICLLENTTAASEGLRAGRSRVEVRLHQEGSHLS